MSFLVSMKNLLSLYKSKKEKNIHDDGFYKGIPDVDLYTDCPLLSPLQLMYMYSNSEPDLNNHRYLGHMQPYYFPGEWIHLYPKPRLRYDWRLKEWQEKR